VKFLLKYPKETFDLLLSDTVVKDAQWNRFAIYLLKHKDGLSFRSAVQNKAARLTQLITKSDHGSLTPEEQYEIQRQAVLIVHTLSEFDNQFTSMQPDTIVALKTIWKTDLYKVFSKILMKALFNIYNLLIIHILDV
jgi:transformation/transcription domain-associated protein